MCSCHGRIIFTNTNSFDFPGLFPDGQFIAMHNFLNGKWYQPPVRLIRLIRLSNTVMWFSPPDGAHFLVSRSHWENINHPLIRSVKSLSQTQGCVGWFVSVKEPHIVILPCLPKCSLGWVNNISTGNLNTLIIIITITTTPAALHPRHRHHMNYKWLETLVNINDRRVWMN